MKNTKKKKALLLTTLSSLTLAAGAVALSFGLGKKNANISAGSQVPYSVVFSRETGSFTRIDETTSSTSATTSNGATYYAIAHSNVDVENTGYIAQFGGGMGYDEQYITFSTSPTGGDDFEFQKITGIKIKTSSSGDQTLYAYYSADGESFKNSYPVTCNSNPSKVTFAASQSFIRVGTASVMGRNIVSIELFYECGEVAPEKEVKSIQADFVAGVEQHFGINDEFVPAPVKVTYTDDTYETITEGPTFTGYDMSTLGTQTVTISYGGKTATYKIFVKPTKVSKFIVFEAMDVDWGDPVDLDFALDLENSDLPEYGEPNQIYTFKPVSSSYFQVLGCDGEESGVEEITPNGDGSYSFTVPNSLSNSVYITLGVRYIG